MAALGIQDTGQKKIQKKPHTQHRNIERLTKRTHQKVGVSLGVAEGEAVPVSYKVCTVVLIYSKYTQWNTIYKLDNF